MKVLVASEGRFLRYRGHVYTDSGNAYEYWARYLDVFSPVQVVARVTPASTIPAGSQRADGEGVEVVALPYYQGPSEGVRRLPALLASTRRVAAETGAFILLVPGVIGTLVGRWLTRRGWPYGIQVVGDPQAGLSSQAIGRLWSTWAKPLTTRALRQQCRSAACAAYVTAHYLQERYPARTPFTYHFSDVWLPDALFADGVPSGRWEQQDTGLRKGPVWELLFVGSLEQRYKGLHVLLDALRICVGRGLPLALTVLGDCVHRSAYERQAREMGLADRVRFAGWVPSASVSDHLQRADLFVMPSLTEGLPRALLEAMARGLPCIGSDVGGIPELLAPGDLVPPGDARALAHKIESVLNDPVVTKARAARNHETAGRYRASVMAAERLRFLRKVEESTPSLPHSAR